MRIVNPATGALLRELPEDDPATVAGRVIAARRAQPDWAARPLDERRQAIARFRDRIAESKETLALLLTDEMGKPITQSRNELTALRGRIDFFLEHVAAVVAEEPVHAGKGGEERLSREPLGVIANISAWNYPYFVGSNVFVPALLTGNAVVYKPSELTALTGLAIADALHASGVPADVFSTVVGGGGAGTVLLEQDVDAVFFTGSHATGVKVAEAAGRRLVRVNLELGGKDPVYVCEDVDVDAAVDATADGAFYNAGQSCCSVERLYVHERVYDDFVGRFTRRVQGFVVGDPRDEATYIGPLAREPQLAVLERQVTDARSKGGTLLTGGQRLDRPGSYFAPTVVAEATHAMDLMREESFGPVIGIARVSGDEEALSLMNDTTYGLTAGIYTRDGERARRVLAKVDAGSVYWNCCDRVSPRLPWSGRRGSGIGSTLGTDGIRAFVQPKAWHLRPAR